MAQNYLFGFRDKISKCIDVFAVDVSAPSLIRTYYPAFANRKPIRDIEIYELGTIDDLKIDLYDTPILHEWSEYKFPENKAEALAPLGLNPSEVEKVFNNKNSEIINK